MANSTLKIPGPDLVNNFTVDGIRIDLSGGISTNQILRYNNTSFIGSGFGVSIGDAVTSGTGKSVLFVDGSGNLGQSNTNFAWDATNNRLGIGTNAPSNPLQTSISTVSATTPSNIFGLAIVNSTAATNILDQYSPMLEWKGAGYDGSTSTTVGFALQNQPHVGGGSATNLLYSFNGSAYSSIMTNSTNSIVSITGFYSTTATSALLPSGAAVTWTDFTLKNSYTKIGSPWATPGYTRDGLGRVYVRGAFTTGGTPNAVVATLPAGYRPGIKMRFISIVNLSLFITTIDTNGDITNTFASSYADSYFIDNFHFLAEN